MRWRCLTAECKGADVGGFANALFTPNSVACHTPAWLQSYDASEFDALAAKYEKLNWRIIRWVWGFGTGLAAGAHASCCQACDRPAPLPSLHVPTGC